ncbi:HNH endonuclease signature motif containing protein [Angustibacter speluncae]
MSVGAVGGADPGGATGALAAVTTGLDDLAAAPVWQLTDAELHGAIVEVTAQEARLAAQKSRLLRESVSREAPDARGRRGAVTKAVLTDRCRVSGGRAKADLENAGITCPATGDLRALGQAWAAGQVTREHVDVARRCLDRIPRKVLRERRAEVDAELTERATGWDPQTADKLAHHLLDALLPDGSDRFDEHAHERRHVAVTTDSTGMVLLSGQLDAAGGLTFTATLDAIAEADRHDLRDSGVVDVRTRGQRRADGIVVMAQAAAAWFGLPDQQKGLRVGVPRVVVHVDTSEQTATTATGRSVSQGTLARLVCDAILDRVETQGGRVIAMTSLGRLATGSQRAALAARDRGCVWPGCTAPPALCEAHHVIWWSRGGPTTIDNLALLCSRHHTQIHTQPDDHRGWTMHVHAGRPAFRPPAHHGHPLDTLLRNTFHDDVNEARATGRRWRVPAPDPP